MVAPGFQTVLDRQTFVAQQSFGLWETELKSYHQNLHEICCFILGVVPSSKRLKILRHR